MKKSLLLSLAAITAFSAAAAEPHQWSIKGNAYTADTLFHAEIGPGTTQTSIALSGNLKLRVFYTTVDLTNPYVDIRAAKAGNVFSQCQVLPNQAQQYDKEGARYFAGINADFFANSAPVANTIVNGEVFNCSNTNRTSWYMTDDKVPHIANLGYNGTCYFPDGSTHELNGINGNRGENGLNIYNLKHNGANSGTNKYGYEVSIEPIEGDLDFSGKSKYKVTSNPVGAGSMAIPEGGYVLSGHYANNSTAEYAGYLISKLKIGDEITLDLYPSLNGVNITQMASGIPIILQNGTPLDNESIDANLLSNRHPRTAIGYSADRKKLIMMIVDGRSAISAGVTSSELADIMREAGCDEAMNFDGGGSSALYTTALGYRNVPSDGTPRAVTNSVWAVYTAPDDNNVARLAFTKKVINLPKYGQYTPQLYAYNQYGLLFNTNFNDYTLSCDPELGTISEDGKTLFVTGTGNHNLTASCGDVTVTIPVVISSSAEPIFRLSEVVLDGTRDYKTEVTANVDGIEMPIDNLALTWSSDDETIATVDENGVISGVATGTTTVKGQIESQHKTITVNVQKPETNHIAVNAAGVTLSKINCKNESVTLGENGKSFDISFMLSSARAPRITAEFGTPLYSLPDSVAVDFTYSDVTVNTVVFSLTPNNGSAKVVNVSGPFTPNKVNRAMLPISDFTDVTDISSFPIKLTSIGFAITGSTSTQYKISVVDAHGVYNNASADQGGVNDIIADSDANDAEENAQYFDLLGRPATPSPEAPAVLIRRTPASTTKVIQ